MSDAAARKYGLQYFRGLPHDGLSREWGVLHQGCNSGYQALNLAVLLGAKRIMLLGFDMRIVDERRHFFGDHPKGMNVQSNYAQWITKFKTIPPDLTGVEVFNCTKGSALKCFPYKPLKKLL